MPATGGDPSTPTGERRRVDVVPHTHWDREWTGTAVTRTYVRAVGRSRARARSERPALSRVIRGF